MQQGANSRPGAVPARLPSPPTPELAAHVPHLPQGKWTMLFSHPSDFTPVSADAAMPALCANKTCAPVPTASAVASPASPLPLPRPATCTGPAAAGVH